MCCEHCEDHGEVIETADFAAVLNIEYKPGTDEKYMTINVVKRRRIDASSSEFAKYTYLAHPFSKTNGLRLIDDVNLDKVLSLKSLTSDIIDVSKDKTNAVPRLKTMQQTDFMEFENYNDDI